MSEMKHRRLEMYKARTPPWKETYRMRCLERLRENRARHQWLHRRLQLDDVDLNSNSASDNGEMETNERGSTHDQRTEVDIESVMNEEWELMKKERAAHGLDVHNTVAGANDSHYYDAMCSLYEEIRDEIRREIHADLRKEELQLLSLQKDCDDFVREEEEELCSALQTLTTDEVICPLCEKSALIENKGVIVCQCGLRINTEQDCISLRNVKENLQTGTEEHSENCGAKPMFSLSHKFGISNMLMSCEECDFLYIIV